MSGETRRPWSLEEDQAIQVIVQDLGTKRWSEISQTMQEKFKLYGRSGKQCRERWHNHLAPDVNKKPWSHEQEQALFQAHKKFGNKWTQISKLIEGRTDNAIKNHFYSSIRRSLRRINKILGSKNSTVKMRNIKPAVLSAIFNMADHEQAQDSQYYKDLTQALIEFSRNRVKKQSGINNQQKLGLQNLIKKLTEFNDTYEKQKKIGKNNGYMSQTSKINQQNSSDSKKISVQDDELEGEQEQQEACSQRDIHNQQASIMASLSEQGSIVKKMNLEQSEYDWQEFQQRCQTIVNRFLQSQCSLKSIQNLAPQQANNSEASQTTYKSVTLLKSENDTQLSSRDSIQKKRKAQ